MKIAILISALFLIGCNFDPFGDPLTRVHVWPATPICNPDCAGEDERQKQYHDYLCNSGYTDDWNREQAIKREGIECIESVAVPQVVESVPHTDELVKACAIENKAERRLAVKNLGYHYISS